MDTKISLAVLDYENRAVDIIKNVVLDEDYQLEDLENFLVDVGGYNINNIEFMVINDNTTFNYYDGNADGMYRITSFPIFNN